MTLSVKEQWVGQVIVELAAGMLSTQEAALVLGVSNRQVRRLKDANMHSAIRGRVPGNRGRPPANCALPGEVEEALRLCGPENSYHDFSICHAHQMLQERHNLSLGRSTLERLLREGGTRVRRRAA